MNNFTYFSNNDEITEKIKRLLEDYKFTLKSLSKITGLDYLWLINLVDGKTTLSDLTNANRLSLIDRLALSDMIFMLSDGIPIVNEDDRVKGIINVLVYEFEITYETIAIYAGMRLEELQSFMTDTNSISYEKKYKLATVSLFLHYLFKKPPKAITEK